MKLTITTQFQEFILSLGLSMEDLLRRAGIPNLLWKEELVVTDQEYYRLLHEFDLLVTDEQLLAFSEVKNINMFMPPIFAALSAQNGIEALHRFATYKKLIGPVSIRVQALEEVVSVHFSFIYPEQKLPRFALLNEQLLLISLLRTGSGADINPLTISGPFEYGGQIEGYVGAVPEVGEENQLVFKVEDLNRPFLTQNNSMWQYLEPALKNKLAELSAQRSFSSTVQTALFQAIPSGNFSLEEIAHSLGVSPRTLQRNLSAEGTAFNQQLQATQKMLALNYVQNDSLNMNEITYLVGYADPSSFSRAFKKWTGKTISHYKKENTEKREG
ncbi:helix-turn-helix domain-containing protein [Bacillus sp. YH3-2-B2]